MCSRASGHPTSRQAAPSRSMGMQTSWTFPGRQKDSRPPPMPPGRQGSEDCSRSDDFPRGTPPAMAYVPWQQWQNIYEICRGFERGTIFEDLDKPFTGKGGRRQ